MTRMQRLNRIHKLRSAFITSVCSLLLCISMLTGSTYAWLSDTASTLPLDVQAGNLQVELQKWDNKTNDYVAVNTSDGVFDPGFLWEPGKMQIVSLAVKNTGSLAANVNVIMKVQNGGLADQIEFLVLDQGTGEPEKPVENWEDLKNQKSVNVDPVKLTEAPKAVVEGPKEDNTLNGVQAVLLLGQDGDGTAQEQKNKIITLSPASKDNDTHYFAIGLKMNNEPNEDYGSYMLKTLKLDVLVNAVQTTGDSDQFGDKYDENLPLPAPHTYYLANMNDEKNDIETAKIMNSAENWNDLCKYIINEKKTGEDATKQTSEIKKVVFGRWNEHSTEVGEGKVWDKGIDVTYKGKEENTNKVKGFYNESTKALYILVGEKEPMGYIAIEGEMGSNLDDGGYFSNWTALTEVDFSCLNTSDLGSGDNNSQPASMGNLFSGCTKLEKITFGSGFVTSNVNDMRKMFYGCSNLTTLDDLSIFNTSKVKNMAAMFNGCEKLTELNLSTFDTRQVSEITLGASESLAPSEKTAEGLFEGCTKLETVKLTPSIFTLEKVENMSNMFKDCAELAEVNLKGLKTSKATNMSSMFENCKAIESLDLSPLDTSKVTNMSSMFAGCEKVTSLDLSTLDTNCVINMNSLFKGCTGLTKLDLLGKFSVYGATDLQSMFEGCTSITELDLSGFNTNPEANITKMFYNDSSLQIIYATSRPVDQAQKQVGFLISNTEYSDVFTNCSKLNESGFSGEPKATMKTDGSDGGVMKYNGSYTTSQWARTGYKGKVGLFGLTFTCDGYFTEKPESEQPAQ